MRYMGSKARLGKTLASIIQPYVDNSRGYVEPFFGVGGVHQYIHHKHKIGSDLNSDLIYFWKALQLGWKPPYTVTYDEYRKVQLNKNAYDYCPHLRAFIAFGCSFGGKEWGGYARDKKGVNYARQARNSSLKKAKGFTNTKFYSIPYNAYNPASYKGYVFYCDPPYANTTKYKTGDFDSVAFWVWCRKMAKAGNVVFVSEYTAPKGVTPVWSRGVAMTMDNNNGKRVERLYRLGKQWLSTN